MLGSWKEDSRNRILSHIRILLWVELFFVITRCLMMCDQPLLHQSSLSFCTVCSIMWWRLWSPCELMPNQVIIESSANQKLIWRCDKSCSFVQILWALVSVSYIPPLHVHTTQHIHLPAWIPANSNSLAYNV